MWQTPSSLISNEGMKHPSAVMQIPNCSLSQIIHVTRSKKCHSPVLDHAQVLKSSTCEVFTSPGTYIRCQALPNSFLNLNPGASSTGVDSIFIAGGIHADELGVSQSSLTMNDEALETLVKSHNVMPTYVMPYLNWQVKVSRSHIGKHKIRKLWLRFL